MEKESGREREKESRRERGGYSEGDMEKTKER